MIFRRFEPQRDGARMRVKAFGAPERYRGRPEDLQSACVAAKQRRALEEIENAQA